MARRRAAGLLIVAVFALATGACGSSGGDAAPRGNGNSSDNGSDASGVAPGDAPTSEASSGPSIEQSVTIDDPKHPGTLLVHAERTGECTSERVNGEEWHTDLSCFHLTLTAQDAQYGLVHSDRSFGPGQVGIEAEVLVPPCPDDAASPEDLGDCVSGIMAQSPVQFEWTGDSEEAQKGLARPLDDGASLPYSSVGTLTTTGAPPEGTQLIVFAWRDDGTTDLLGQVPLVGGDTGSSPVDSILEILGTAKACPSGVDCP